MNRLQPTISVNVKFYMRAWAFSDYVFFLDDFSSRRRFIIRMFHSISAYIIIQTVYWLKIRMIASQTVTM